MRYALGEVWEEAALAGAKRPKMSRPTGTTRRSSYVGLEGIDRVYLRKQCGRRRADDDAYQLDVIEVTLYGDAGAEARVPLARRRSGWASSTALQVWLPEVDSGLFSVSRRV